MNPSTLENYESKEKNLNYLSTASLLTDTKLLKNGST